MHAVYIVDFLPLNPLENCPNVLAGIRDFLCPDNGFEHLFCIGLVLVMYDSRAVYEINPLCQSDVLPGFGLSRDRSHLATRLFHQRVDH